MTNPNIPHRNKPHTDQFNRFRTLLDEKKTAQMLGLSPRTLQMWRLKGEGPPFVRLGAAIRYDLEEVNRWLDDQTRKSTSDPGPAAA